MPRHAGGLLVLLLLVGLLLEAGALRYVHGGRKKRSSGWEAPACIHKQTQRLRL